MQNKHTTELKRISMGRRRKTSHQHRTLISLMWLNNKPCWNKEPPWSPPSGWKRISAANTREDQCVFNDSMFQLKCVTAKTSLNECYTSKMTIHAIVGSVSVSIVNANIPWEKWMHRLCILVLLARARAGGGGLTENHAVCPFMVQIECWRFLIIPKFFQGPF